MEISDVVADVSMLKPQISTLSPQYMPYSKLDRLRLRKEAPPAGPITYL